MEEANVQLKQIKQKVKALVTNYKHLKIEKDRLAEQNEVLATTVIDLNKKIEEIQNKNLNLQLSRVLGKGDAGETDLKHRLDEYIREIEATIAHLKD